MHTAVRLSLALAACCMVGSCATRRFCSRDAPKLPHRNGGAAGERSEVSRVSQFVAGQSARDGFKVEAVQSIKEFPVCGMPLLSGIYTLGLVPVMLPAPAEVTVVGESGETRTYSVALHSWTSVWHAMVPKRSDDRALARGLLEAMNTDAPLPRAVR